MILKTVNSVTTFSKRSGNENENDCRMSPSATQTSLKSSKMKKQVQLVEPGNQNRENLTREAGLEPPTGEEEEVWACTGR